MIDKFFAKIERYIPTRWRWVLSHGGFRRYLANTGWMFLGQFLSLLLSFFIGAWVARYLGPENYGIVNYAAAFVGIFGFLAGLGVDGVISRDLVKMPDREKELMGTGFSLKLLGGLIAFAAVAIADLFVVASTLTRFLVFLYGLSYFIAPFSIVSLYFQAKVQAKKNVRAGIVAALISSGLKIIFIFSGAGLGYLVAIYVLDTFWQTAGLFIAYRKSGNRLRDWTFDRVLAKDLWSDGWPLMLSGAASYIYLRVDQVLIGHLMDTMAVGIYAAAVKITEIWNFVPVVITSSLFPAIINAKARDAVLYGSRLRNLYRLLIGSAVLIAIPVTILARPVIVFLFGTDYAASVPILQIYVWSGIGMFLSWAVNNYLVAESRSKMVFVASVSAMVINVGLNLLLIPSLGLVGSALSTLVSYLSIPLIVLIDAVFWKRSQTSNRISL